MGKLRIKIKPAWFSDEYATLKYSTNGIFWKTLKECQERLYGEHYIVDISRPFDCANNLLKDFDTLDKIKEFEGKEREKCRIRNAELYKRRKKRREEKREFFKKHG